MHTDTIRTRRSERPASLLALVAALIALATLLPGLAHAQDEDAVVLEVGSTTVTRAEFENRFAVATRTLALQQGLEPTEENLAQFDPERERFLDQLATQLALIEEAEERGITVTDDQVDQTLESFRSQFETEEAFHDQIDALGFASVEDLRANVRENLRIRAFIEELAADIEVGEEEIAAFYDENPEQFRTEDDVAVPFEDVRGQIEQFLVQQELSERVEDIRAEADVQTYPENL